MPVVFAQNWGEHNSALHNNRDGIRVFPDEISGECLISQNLHAAL
jgi:hypothetical protein